MMKYARSQVDEEGVQAVVQHLRRSQHSVWSEHVHLLELNEEVAVVKDGRLLTVINLPSAAPGNHPLLQEGIQHCSQPNYHL